MLVQPASSLGSMTYQPQVDEEAQPARQDGEHGLELDAHRSQGAEAAGEDAEQGDEGHALGGHGHEPGDGVRRGLVGIGRPLMEGHGRDLEEEAHEHEGRSHEHQRVQGQALAAQAERRRRQIKGAAEAVDEHATHEEAAGGHRAGQRVHLVHQLLDGLRIKVLICAVCTRVYFSSLMKNSTSSTGIIWMAWPTVAWIHCR